MLEFLKQQEKQRQEDLKQKEKQQEDFKRLHESIERQERITKLLEHDSGNLNIFY